MPMSRYGLRFEFGEDLGRPCFHTPTLIVPRQCFFMVGGMASNNVDEVAALFVIGVLIRLRSSENRV